MGLRYNNMTMTYAEADRIIETVSEVLQFGPDPNRAELEAWKKHIDGHKLVRFLLKNRIDNFFPQSVINRLKKIIGTESYRAAGKKAKNKVIQSNPVLSKYSPIEIDAALKIGIAQMYLGLKRMKVSEEEFVKYVNASNPTILSLQGWFETIDRTTLEMLPEWRGIETESSFVEFCKSVGENDPEY